MARLVNDLRATGYADSGSGLYFSDADRIEVADIFNGDYVYVHTGGGSGQERAISDFASPTFQVSPTWATTLSTNAQYAVTRTWRWDDYKTAVQFAVRSRRRKRLLSKLDDTTTLTAGTYTYAVPSGFAGIYQLALDEEGNGIYTRPVPGDAWYIAKVTGSRQVVFDSAWADETGWIVSGATMRIMGQAYETEPSADTDEIESSTVPIIFLAAQFLQGMQIPKDTDRSHDRRAMYQMLEQRAEEEVKEETVRFFPGTKLVDD